jgi:hypothetical protein
MAAQVHTDVLKPYSFSTGCVHEICKLIQGNFVAYKLFTNSTWTGFSGPIGEEPKSGEILSVNTILNEATLTIEFGILKITDTENHTLPAKTLLDFVTRLGEKTTLVKKGDIYAVAIKVNCEQPLGITRRGQLIEKIKSIAEFTKYLQEAVAKPSKDYASLLESYKSVSGLVNPVMPLGEGFVIPQTMNAKAKEVTQLLKAGISIAITYQQKITSDFFLAILSKMLSKQGQTIGYYIESSLLTRGVPEVLEKAPGFLAVPSIVLSNGSNAYERGSEIESMMNQISRNGKPIVFLGTYSEHQGIFGSGQGIAPNPLMPVVVRSTMDVAPDQLVAFAAEQEKLAGFGVTDAALKEITATVMQLISSGDLNGANIDLIRSLVRSRIAGKDELTAFFKTLTAKKESFRGLNVFSRHNRNAAIQQRMLNALLSGSLIPFLSTNLVGQEAAIAEFDARLRTDVMCRSQHQPIRVLLQGIPGTGKSQVCELLAKYLDVPHVMIDTASLQSQHNASSLLLGSGRGIVMSHMPGKLETIAQHHDGVVVEIADLDHCIPEVRGFLGDLFLHILETGLAQTATGETISCSQVVFIFTINLPRGMDSQVLKKGLGFNATVNAAEILSRTMKEIKAMFSGAFVSRVGLPVLFKAFTEDDKADIMEMAIARNATTSLENILVSTREIVVVSGTGKKFLERIHRLDSSLGARIIYDLARSLVADLVLENIASLKSVSTPIEISAINADKLIMHFIPSK